MKKDTRLTRPNVVFILVDDMGHGDIGYHNGTVMTPHLDALSGQGVRLGQHYSLHLCGPSRACLLTGLYQTHNAVYRNINIRNPTGLPVSLTTLADHLGRAGYMTHAVGKWHMGWARPAFLPTRRGFHTFQGVVSGMQDHYTYKRCVPRMKTCGIVSYINDKPTTSFRGQHSTSKYSRRTIELITQQAQAIRTGKKTKPMFIYLALSAPHAPLQAPKHFLHMYQNVTDTKRRNFLAMITHLDHWIGKIHKALVMNSLWNNTIIVFASDNGGVRGTGSGGPLLGVKGTLYEGGIRTPAFVASPLLKQTGVVTEELFHMTDWFPTVLSAAGVTPSHIDQLHLDGMDQWDMIRTGGYGRRSEALLGLVRRRLFTNGTEGCGFDTRTKAAYRLGPWKLITGLKDTPGRLSLYNLREDPFEITDMHHSRPDIVQQLCNKLQHHLLHSRQGVLTRYKSPLARPRRGFYIPYLPD